MSQPAKPKTMYYAGFCRICETGPLGLRACGACGQIVLLCDECDAIWTTADVDAPPYLTSEPELPCPTCAASLFAAPSHWANMEEIESTDWLQKAISTGQIFLNEGEAFEPSENLDLAENDGTEPEATEDENV